MHISNILWDGKKIISRCMRVLLPHDHSCLVLLLLNLNIWLGYVTLARLFWYKHSFSQNGTQEAAP